MKKIIVNGRFYTRRITGVERYAREILRELDEIIKPGEIEIAVPSNAFDVPKFNNIRVVELGMLHGNLWEQLLFPWYVFCKNAISLNLCNTAPLVSPGIVCIHDMKIKARPQDFSPAFLLWYKIQFLNSCKRSKRIITVSKFSQKEIMKYYNVSENKITVIYNAWQHFNRIDYDEGTLKKYNLKSNGYYFTLSSLEPNKNFKWIVETAKKNPQKRFVVSGAMNNKIFAEKNRYDLQSNIQFLGYVPDSEAKTLMRDCEAFLFPTFYEGYGIPPLEALSAGCKNIYVSDTEVMHEIYGNAARYVDPMRAEKLDHIASCSDTDTIKKVLDKYKWSVGANTLLQSIRMI